MVLCLRRCDRQRFRPFDPSQGGIQNSTWVNYGTFFQGVGALGGGNVNLKAAADIDDISASLPETIEVSGGQSSGDPPVTHYFGGGDLTVQAGGNLNSSAFYVGRGTGTIDVGGAVQADPNNPVTGTPTQLIPITYSGGGVPDAQRGRRAAVATGRAGRVHYRQCRSKCNAGRGLRSNADHFRHVEAR